MMTGNEISMLNATLIAEAVSTRTDMLVRFHKSQGIEDQKTISNFTKLGRIPGESLKGWIWHGME